MATYRVGTRSATSAATLNIPIAYLWNPHATARLSVSEIHIANTAATVCNFGVLRGTTVGTPAVAALAAGIATERGREMASPAGATVAVSTWTTPPTADGTVHLMRWNLPAVVGAGVIFTMPDGLIVPAGTGLGVVAALAVAQPACDVTFVWHE